jgi:DNA topoisomerase II
VLLRPDTYIGSVKVEEQQMWVWSEEKQSMEFRTISFPPGMYKIFDEILVNAADNYQRSGGTMKSIKVTIDAAAGRISVWNDGKGIPIEMHKVEKVMVPELIFGELLTGSNFSDAERKVTGGRNGFGAKLANIFSTRFELECVDSSRGKHYKQIWTSNMDKKTEPAITSSSKGSDFVQVTFT